MLPPSTLNPDSYRRKTRFSRTALKCNRKRATCAKPRGMRRECTYAREVNFYWWWVAEGVDTVTRDWKTRYTYTPGVHRGAKPRWQKQREEN